MRATAHKQKKVSAQPGLFALLVVCALGLIAAVLPAVASAAPPPQLWQTGETGSGAGQTSIPRGIAADPVNGHVFVADQVNRRVVEFNALGQFVKAWGWDVVASGPGDTGVGFEICVPENGDVCKAGVEGTGTGQFASASPKAVALDSAGNIYVVDWQNHRVQKFDPEGHFLLMFGGEVNKTKTEEVGSTEAEQNLCPVAPGDICQAGAESIGNGQFVWPAEVIGSFIAIETNATATTADDKVYVGDQNRIQVFDAAGHYGESLPLPGETVRSLAVDASGNLYVAYAAGAESKPDVHKLSPTGAPLSPTFKVKSPSAVAVDAAGRVYAFGPVHTQNNLPLDPIFEFDPDGTQIANFGIGDFSGSTGLATNLCSGSEAPGDLYVTNASSTDAFLRAYGTAPTGCFNANTGAGTNVTETTATLNGTVTPEGTVVTECRFEYGTTTAPYQHTAPCAETSAQIGTGTSPKPVHAGIGGLAPGTVYHFRLRAKLGATTETGSDQTFKTLGPPVVSAETASDVAYTEATLKALVNPEGFAAKYHFEYGLDTSYGQSTPEIGAGSDRTAHAALATLEGLIPGMTYHWRIVASNSSSEKAGHPTEGPDRTFTTYLTPAPETNCPNEAFRSGPSANLPDCRAYEMVSPLDKNGGDILHPNEDAGYVQTSADGEKIVYGAAPSFGDQPANLGVNQYLATRQAGAGWPNHGIHPPLQEGKPAGGVFLGISREFEAFSPDLCSAWFQDNLTPPLTAEGQMGFPNIYRLDLCGEEGPEALTTTEPPPGTEGNYVNIFGQSVAGYSGDSSHAFFAASAALTPEAAANDKAQIYDRFGGGLHLVSVLPDGSADPAPDGVGSGPGHNLDNAASADGSRVYWTSNLDESTGRGKIFLREHPEQGAVAGECTEPALACTVPVSSGPVSLFWAGAADGSGALYGEGEDLFEFDLQKYEEGEPSRRLIAHHIQGVLGASDDLSRIYFVSSDELTPGQKNSEGDEAQATEPNLYLDQGGALTFVATLVPGDVQTEGVGEGRAYTLVSKAPYFRATRVSPDGARIAFQSRAPLIHGFDNTHPTNGEADVEVFTYKAGGSLSCVSCSPSGARPSGPELREPYIRVRAGERETHVFAAAWIPTWEHPLYSSHVLSDDGGHLFFNSYEALVPADTNGAMDVYEWEAPGSGSCTQESPSFHQANGGCLSLISSGESPFESEFWDASADGRDVFFSTESSLLPQDPGLVDLYDARSGGGFPQPTQAAACEGEACQSPPAPPNDPTPTSSAFEGAGNVVERPAKKKHSKKRKHHKRHQGRANHNRRAAR